MRNYVELLDKIITLKNSALYDVIKNKIREFEKTSQSSNKELFKELCFCVLTANYNAKKAIEICNDIGDGFIYLSLEDLKERLKKLGYRYPNKRAEYIVYNRRLISVLKEIIEKNRNRPELVRGWLVKNFKGIGYKEASHFLRNIGFKNLAIIDLHILNVLKRFLNLNFSSSIKVREYLEIENLLKELAIETDLSLAELDLFLWYMETGKVLK